MEAGLSYVNAKSTFLPCMNQLIMHYNVCAFFARALIAALQIAELHYEKNPLRTFGCTRFGRQPYANACAQFLAIRISGIFRFAQVCV